MSAQNATAIYLNPATCTDANIGSKDKPLKKLATSQFVSLTNTFCTETEQYFIPQNA